MLHPAQNRRVRHRNATLSHHGHEIPITQFLAEVPTNAQHHDLLIEVPAFEQLFNVYEPWHVSIIAAPVGVCTRALLAERGVEVDPSCIWRWVQAYAPELNKRCRPHLKPTNKSYRTDET